MNFIVVGFIFLIFVAQIIVWVLIRKRNKKDYMRQIDLTLLYSVISLLCGIVCLSTRHKIIA